jgi:hypothetical protein
MQIAKNNAIMPPPAEIKIIKTVEYLSQKLSFEIISDCIVVPYIL